MRASVRARARVCVYVCVCVCVCVCVYVCVRESLYLSLPLPLSLSLFGWVRGRETDRHTDRQINRQTDIEKPRQTYRQYTQRETTTHSSSHNAREALAAVNGSLAIVPTPCPTLGAQNLTTRPAGKNIGQCVSAGTRGQSGPHLIGARSAVNDRGRRAEQKDDRQGWRGGGSVANKREEMVG